MEIKVTLATLILLGLVTNQCWANQITDCETEDSDYDFDSDDEDSEKSYETLKLYCGRTPIKFTRCISHDYYDSCSSHAEYTCYEQIFSSGKSKQVEHLKTNDCRGDRLEPKITANLFTSLQTYDVSYYGIRDLTSSDLQFRGLTKFIATHNNLTKISESLFVNTPLILEIDFSYNEITALAGNVFDKASTLTQISLAYNKIRSIKVETFSSLTHLRLLDLSNNAIEAMHKDFFKNNKKLETLKLHANPIKRIDCSTFPHSTQLTIDISCTLALEFNMSCAEDRVNIFPNEVIRFFEEPKPTIRCIEVGVNDLKYFNISQNYLENTFELIELLDTPIEIMDVSSNYVSRLDANVFKKFTNLKYLDLRSTKLSAINFQFARYNKKLQMLRLEGNPIKRIECNIFSVLLNSVSVNVSWKNVEEIDTSCLHNAIEIIVSNETSDAVIFRAQPTKSELRCEKSHFHQFTYFNASTNQLKNTPALIDLLGPEIETLDVSFNYVGNLTAHTFHRFNSLKCLNLSHTELSNFRFNTFYHQRRLKMLDVSYNHLGKVNFTLFLRIFKNLETLNLEGNDLVEINSITKTIFPKLSLLGISKNNFSCEYIVKFLHPWTDLNLLDNPSNQTHIDGIDCHHHEEAIIQPEITTHQNQHTTLSTTSDYKSTVNVAINENRVSSDIQVLKYMFLGICAMFCIYIVIKSKIIGKTRQKFEHFTFSNRLPDYQQNHHRSQQNVELIENGSICE